MSINLLCTFAQTDRLQDTLDKIQTRYELVYNYMYVLYNEETSTELFITYNTNSSYGNCTPVEDTILIHRKKESNTLYTINALNTLIQSLNNGRLDSTFIVNWSDYRNSIVLTDMNKPRIIKTKIFKIIDISSN